MHDGRISIIIPVLDEAAVLSASLTSLQPLRQRGHEVLVVDGGSRDGSLTIARRLADRVLMSGPGRAQQMNAGAASASHEILLFLYSDSRLPPDADSLITGAMQAKGIWGYFAVQEARAGWRSAFTNWRSSLTGLVNGRQVLFAERTWFERLGGFSDPGEPDKALSRKLKNHEWPLRVSAPVVVAR